MHVFWGLACVWYEFSFINGRMMISHVLIKHAVIGFVITLDLLHVHNCNTQGYHHELFYRKVALDPTIYHGDSVHIGKRWDAC